MQQDNDPKHSAKTTKEFIRGKKWKVLDWPSQSPHLNPVEYAFYLLKKRLKGVTPPKLKEAAVKAWKSITKEECKSLVMSMGHRLNAVIESKRFATKYLSPCTHEGGARTRKRGQTQIIVFNVDIKAGLTWTETPGNNE